MINERRSEKGTGPFSHQESMGNDQDQGVQSLFRTADLEEFVAAFESARAVAADAELSAFLPSAGHPLYRAVLAELIRVDLEYGWHGGRPQPLEEYQRRFPQIAADAEAWGQIAFEDYRLRCQAGEPASAAEYQRRFGVNIAGWAGLEPIGSDGAAELPATCVLAGPLTKAASQVAVFPEAGEERPSFGSGGVVRSSRSYGNRFRSGDSSLYATEPVNMPEVGSEFLDFHLVAELGRGAFGRVFLARQGDLAGRPVALKISTDLFNESQTLAQLQHTNIVPIYSAHDCPPLQAVCMPYLGCTTLADVLRSILGRESLPVSGRELVTTLARRRQPTLALRQSSLAHAATVTRDDLAAGSGSPKVTPESDLVPPRDEHEAQITLKRIEGYTYVQTILWIGARLADGLAHAHEHNVIHRDLKPANALLADDGQPLLLDFNVADNRTLRSSPLGASVGGTLPYMAPEQLRSFHEHDRSADARSDIYSLGLILYELLSGQAAYPFYKGPMWEMVPVMITDRKTLPAPLRKWNKAVSPAVDSIIRHCLEPDVGKRYQSARQLQEDLERQLENRPLRHARETSLVERVRKWARRHPRLTSSTSVALVGLLCVAGLATALTIRGHRLARFDALENLEHFRADLRDAQFVLYGRNPDQQKLSEGLEQCQQALGRYQVLDNPDWTAQPALKNLPEAERAQARAEIGEALFLAARATLLRATYRPEQPPKDQIVLAYNMSRSAEGCYEEGFVPRALREQQEELLRHQGKLREAAELLEKAKKAPLRTARDCYLLAHVYAMRGEFRRALPRLEEAVQKDPRSFSAWFVKGNCHYELLHHGEAAACYSTCIALRPKFHWSWFNRGLAHLRLGSFERALADFDQTIVLKPELAEGYFNRGLANDGLGRFQEAIADLTRALELGTPRTQVYFLRAAVRERAKDLAGAQRDRDEGMRRTPTDEQSWVARGLARLPRDPKGALADFEKALNINPRSFPAMQNIAHVCADHLHDDGRAVAVLDRLLKLFPDCAMGRAGRGVSLARLGQRQPAIADGEHALLLDTRPPNLYQVSCIYALTSKQHPQDRLRAYELLSYGLKGGFGLDLVDSDSDLNPIRQTAEFRRILEAVRSLQPGRPQQ